MKNLKNINSISRDAKSANYTQGTEINSSLNSSNAAHTMKQNSLVPQFAKYLSLVLLGIIFVFPFVFMINKSFMGDLESMALPVKFLPQRINIGSYFLAVDAKFLKYLFNTLYVIGFNVIAVPIASSLCAYGFAKVDFKGSKVLFAIVIATMLLPGIVLQIPTYIMYIKVFHWDNTLNPLTIPSMFGGGAMNIFLLTQFMKGIPNEIRNAAKIDGANLLKIYSTIMIPLCKPILIFVAVNTFLGVWNDFTGPLIYLQNEENYTLAVGIYYKFTGAFLKDSYPNIQMATGVLLSIPPAILFFIFQKQLVEGVTMGSLKG